MRCGKFLHLLLEIVRGAHGALARIDPGLRSCRVAALGVFRVGQALLHHVAERVEVVLGELLADPGCDIGTFIACSDYTPEEAEQVIARYLGHAPTGAELRHYIGYVAMASYFWFLWGLYQEACAKHVGEYLYIWYKYTKQYARLTLERYDHEEEFA